uniref:Uncharacterized protein n=1 Tax=Romanomermis culicivorax TaxID=13658 RepID=A0A915KBP9_ROMCU
MTKRHVGVCQFRASVSGDAEFASCSPIFGVEDISQKCLENFLMESRRINDFVPFPQKEQSD